MLKWAGLVLCLLIMTAWIASGRWGVYLYVNRYLNLGYPLRCVSLLDGGVYYWEIPFISVNESGIHMQSSFFGWHSRWIPHLRPSTPTSQYEVFIPLWIPFLPVAIPTAILWWRDRRRCIPPGHCRKCGYNLTGNVSGVCPECGEVV
jgi:hypothetical protein